MPHALLVEDDARNRKLLAAIVQQDGFETSTAGTLKEARKALAAARPDVVLLDVNLPDGNGVDFLEELDQPDLDVIIITGEGTIDLAVQAMRRGATDFLTKPVDRERLGQVLRASQRVSEYREQVSNLRQELRDLGRFGKIVGASESMQSLYDLISRAAPTSATILITGETGTGKELVARTVHALSTRARNPFVAVNCGAVAETLIESELFGHEKGSFTGADRQRKGFFEEADGGTLFLDEITEMPKELQVRLLRVLEERKVRRVGGTEDIPVDVRVIAATNSDPQEAVGEGKLREDLLYRLAVFPITLPPLRERGADVELLAQAFLAARNEAEKTKKRFSTGAIERLEAYSWPGNVRELKNVVERAYIMATNDRIRTRDLPLDDAIARQHHGSSNGLGITVGMSIAAAERTLILATLEELDGDKKAAAETLGISLKTLYNRLNAYEKSDG